MARQTPLLPFGEYRPDLSDLPANRELVHAGDDGQMPGWVARGGSLPSPADLQPLLARADAIAAMEGMSFDTPKGKMTFRKEDHQAMQSMYHFKIKVDPAFTWGVPELVREIKAEDMAIPIRNKR